MTKTSYITVVKVIDDGDTNYYIMLTDEGLLHGWRTQAAALAYFTDSYNRNHRRSYEASMSACLHWMFFQPSVIELTDVAVVRGWLPDPNNPERYNLHFVAGGLSGLKLDPKSGARLWKAGAKPALITKDANRP